MNAFEFMERMKNLSEDKLKHIVIGATWDLEDVDCQIENNEDEDFSEMTDDEKLEILERSVNNCGEYGDDEVRDAIMQELELWLLRHKTRR